MASKALAAGAAPIQGIAKMKRRGQLLLLAGVGLTDHLANDGRIRKRLTGLVT